MSAVFSGMVAVVTGASSGIGKAIAVMLAKRGAVVTLNGRDSDKLEDVSKQCSKVSARPLDSFLTVVGDVTNGQTRRAMIEKTVEKFGRLDILVNNAGVSRPDGKVDDHDEEGFDFVMDVNMKSAYFLSKMAVPHLEKSGGCIVNISSMLSTTVWYSCTAYSMSKAAVDQMTRCLALGLAPLGIRVNAINPSWVADTGIMREFPDFPKGDPQTVLTQHEMSKQPMNGKCVTADDVASCVCFMVSQEARFITGQCLVLDGGRHFLGSS